MRKNRLILLFRRIWIFLFTLILYTYVSIEAYIPKNDVGQNTDGQGVIVAGASFALQGVAILISIVTGLFIISKYAATQKMLERNLEVVLILSSITFLVMFNSGYIKTLSALHFFWSAFFS